MEENGEVQRGDGWDKLDEQIDDLRANWGQDALALLQTKLEAIKQTHTDPSLPAPNVGHTIWEVKWQIYEDRLMAKEPSANLRWRFNDAKDIAIQQREKYGLDECITPPSWNKHKFCEDNLDDLRHEVLDQRWKYAIAAWDEIINNAATMKGLMTLLKDTQIEAIPTRPGEKLGPSRESMNAQQRTDENLDLLDLYGFDEDRSGYPERHWTNKGVLGEGSFGIATLWVRHDNAGRISERLVIKQNALTREDWLRPQTWYGQMSERKPMEYALNQRIGKVDHSSNVVDCTAYATYDNHSLYRLYMEYCPHGTLTDMARKYIAHGDILDEIGVPFKENDRNRIPVRIIWSIFEALASAACLMHNGYLPYQEPNTAVFPFIHRDIKPDNIFLAAPDRQNWKEIPIPKLGDYGIAIPVSDHWSRYPGAGTPGFQAPEQYMNNPEPDIRVTTKSDIWSIGRTILWLMNLEYGKASEIFTFESNENYPVYAEGVEEYYPEALRVVVMGCLEKYPKDRYTAQELWEAIHSQVAGMKGLSDDTSTIMKLQEHDASTELLLYEEDRHKVWAR